MLYHASMTDDQPQSGFLRHILRPSWVDLSAHVMGTNEYGVGPGIDMPTAKLWALVLASRNIPYLIKTRSERNGGGHTVQVRKWMADKAAEEIRLYHEENVPDGKSLFLHDLRPASTMEPTTGAMACLVLFFWFYSRTYPAWALFPRLWVERGSAEAWAILDGQWWRVFTALTLHADGAHVVGNAVIGGVFIWLASRRLGSGLAWFLTILGGGIGNFINAMALAPPHNAIGFSTASFAAAGILAGIAPFGIGGGTHGLGLNGRSTSSLGKRSYHFIRSAMIPVAAGLGLLAMLGAGEDTDLGAHLFGFLTGLTLGGIAGLLTTRNGLPSSRSDILLFISAIALPISSWCIAWLA